MSEQKYTVNVSNIPNEASDEETKEYLSIVGPIKYYIPSRNGCKSSARVGYYDLETAMMAVNYLGYKDFKGRPLKINFEGTERSRKINSDDQIYEELSRLPADEKVKMAHMISKYFKNEGKDFAYFISRHEKIYYGLKNMLSSKRSASNSQPSSYSYH